MFKKSMTAVVFAALLMVGVLQAHAQQIRFFTVHGPEVYEVIEGSRTAAQFVRQARGTILGIPVSGYTDRVARGELILTHISGSGLAASAGIKINGAVAINVPNYPLPSNSVRTVSCNVNADNIVVFVTIGRNRYEKRVPIGTR